MNPKLQDAINAARDGELQAAQQLLTDVLKDDPTQIQAWFLLSHLVESSQKQQAYLGKVLTLDPTHEQARQRLALLRSGQAGGTAQAPDALPAEEPDVLAQAEGDGLPEWMAEDAELVQAETAVAPPETPAATPEEELPEWLQETVSETFLGVTPTATEDTTAPETPPPPATTKATTTPKPPQTTAPQANNQAAIKRWNLILITLSILAIILLILLVNAILAL
jgi:hypothetical protein